MANTYTQLYIHLVFAVQLRVPLILPEWKERLHRYITGIVQNKGHKMLQVHCMPDHAHIFVGLQPKEAISDLVRDIKRDSTNFVNNERLALGRFAWQEGFGAFSYCRREMPVVVRYIQNQVEHHKARSFRKEYEALLQKYGVQYDSKFIFRSETFGPNWKHR